jgi:hypothetical protein
MVIREACESEPLFVLIQGKEKIYDTLKSELVVRYGLSPTATELKHFTNEISDWWDTK